MKLSVVFLDGPLDGQERDFPGDFEGPPHTVTIDVDGVDHEYQIAGELKGVLDEYEKPERLIRSYRWVDPTKHEVTRPPEI
jgi:hypothetical protein